MQKIDFFLRNTYSNLFEQKFSSSSNFNSNKILFELKFEELENLSDDTVLKSFYFFFLIFGRSPSLKAFKSRYHLGRTFYNFSIFVTVRRVNLDFYLSNFFQAYLIDPNKLVFNSNIFLRNANLKISDLKAFYFIESNPHFFKWDKELNILSYSPYPQLNSLNFYVWNLMNIKNKDYLNFWNYYVI